MDKLDFCPNCGAKLDTEDEFCPNCGFNLKEYLKEDSTEASKGEKAEESSHVVKEQKVKQPSEPQKINKQPKKKNNAVVAIAIVIILLIAGYFAGNMYYSEARQEQRLQDEVTSGTAARMQSALVDKDGKQVALKNVDALKRLYVKNSSTVRDIESQISSNQSSNVFSLKKTGKYLLLFPKYKLMIKERTLTVNTNISNPTFVIDGKSVPSKAEDGAYKISKLTPGVYDLKVENIKKDTETKTKQISIGVDNNDATVEFQVQKVKKAPKVITKVIHEKDDDEDKDTDNDSDSDTDSDSDSNDDDSDDTSDDSILGQYTGDPDLSLYSDGTYDLGDKTGTYDILENNDGHVKIRYNQDGGGSIVESYDYSDGELHSDKYDQSWYKD